MVLPRIFVVLAVLNCMIPFVWAQSASVEGQPESTSMASPEPEPAASEAAPAEAGAGLSPTQRGDLLMARRRFREAIDEYQNSLRATAVIYNKIGIAHQQLGDQRAALENYRKALQFDPTYSEAINNIGTVHYGRKNYRKAIQFYEQALEYSPNSASTLSNLGSAYFARKQYDRAFEAYQKAISLDPAVFDTSSAMGTILQERSVEERATYHFYLAKSFAKAGMFDRALDSIRRALEEGFSDRERFQTDPEFQEMQDMEEFQALMVLEPRVL